MAAAEAEGDFKSSCLNLPKYAATLIGKALNSLKAGNPAWPAPAIDHDDLVQKRNRKD
jgi:hypothetical protein